jgi:hypothetical protein
MDTLQITKILRSNPLTKRSFKQCLPIDHLNEPSTFPSSYVVNLDTSDESGSHWVAFYFLRNNLTLYFDSYGNPPPLIINNKNVKRNVNAYQSLEADTCAHHCIVFIYFISLGYSLEQYCKLLDSISNPDLFVQTFVQKLINK